ncbi:DNA-3-methyladenine glycosylase-like [Euwallacea similis]|uniref:DNA-3-methyladenine glycosylase-like n=1 Tax=Euwallacea similis TaxID=1736056 RepID=UPI00344CACA1
MNKVSFTRLITEDFNRECKDMALYFLGKILIRKLEDGRILKGRIVETECYLGNEDKASHSYGGRRTPRNEPMYMPAGTCYVYQTYGMYFCFNISSKESGAAVLLRALEPLEGIDTMKSFRNIRNEKQKENPHCLCNGPSKLCIAMDISKDNCNKLDLSDQENDMLWIEDDPNFKLEEFSVVETSRIGIDKVESEWAKMPLRFYIYGSGSISKRDRKAEKLLDGNT